MGNCFSTTNTDAEWNISNKNLDGLFAPVRIGSSLRFARKRWLNGYHRTGMREYIPNTDNSYLVCGCSEPFADTKPYETSSHIPMICRFKTDWFDCIMCFCICFNLNRLINQSINQNSILVINANFEEKQSINLVVFDTKTESFSKELLSFDLNDVNGIPSFVTIDDYVHMLLSHRSGLGIYVICSSKDRTVRQLEGQYHDDKHFMFGYNGQNQCLTFNERQVAPTPFCINETVKAHYGGEIDDIFFECSDHHEGCDVTRVVVKKYYQFVWL